MSNKRFAQATQNLLRGIDCPYFAEDNREAVQQFLGRFAMHIAKETIELRSDKEVEQEYLEGTVQDIDDMPKEQ